MSLPDSVVAVFLLLVLAGLMWTVGNVVEAWRYERQQQVRPPFRLRIVYRRARPSNVYRFPTERNRAS